MIKKKYCIFKTRNQIKEIYKRIEIKESDKLNKRSPQCNLCNYFLNNHCTYTYFCKALFKSRRNYVPC